jgi:hypothetical protein
MEMAVLQTGQQPPEFVEFAKRLHDRLRPIIAGWARTPKEFREKHEPPRENAGEP